MKRLIMIVIMIGLLAGGFGRSILNAKAAEPKRPEATRYYTSIYIQEGDSLWSIASRFRENSQMTIREYIDELKSMNGLQQETIYKGQYLTVVYFE